MAVAFFSKSAPPPIAVQLAQTSPDLVVNINGAGELPVAKWRSRRFVADALIASKGSRGRTSWINNEGFFVRELGPGDQLG